MQALEPAAVRFIPTKYGNDIAAAINCDQLRCSLLLKAFALAQTPFLCVIPRIMTSDTFGIDDSSKPFRVQKNF